MEQQQQQLNVLSPFLGKAETLVTLVLVLVLSVAWLLWEILTFVHRESEETNHDWWEALKNCPHRRLIIPVSTRGWVWLRSTDGWMRCPVSGGIIESSPYRSFPLLTVTAHSRTAWRRCRSWARSPA